ncbi:hypothetical protein [Enterococcus phage EFLK1]|uniref:Uncharacterized protein n=1 Tax=Enterococcus phage EFLK1 TaxID=1640885 RepID=A0A0E3TA31_9CAUD|nr:hypothetical protein AVT53_gp184 [Enterococcus phage EFLK1]AKC04995.1 hypothetical protein [Enterococcus phage EFLK1]CAD0301116.1 hypothetical protein [Enterococcus phage 156]VDB76947.1 hypothetical protein PHI156_158 [Enterococcus phage 156]
MEKVRLVNDVFSIAESKNFLKEEWVEGQYKIYEIVGVSPYAIIGKSINSRELEYFKPTENRKLFWV